jgi:hypothetical protein
VATCISPKSGYRALNSPRPSTTYPAIPTNPSNHTVTWRVTYTQDTTPDKNIRVTNLEFRRAGEIYLSAKNYIWEYRRGLLLHAEVTEGNRLSFGSTPDVGIRKFLTPAWQSPRLIAPDGGCEIYLSPAMNGQESWKVVGVVGDSLIGRTSFWYTGFEVYKEGGDWQAWEALHNAYPHGWLQNLLNNSQMRVEVDSVGGRAMANIPGTSSLLAQADTNMFDELRGQSLFSNKRALVLALGTNDALGIGTSPDELTAFFRTNAVKEAIEGVLREASNWGTCIVLVTPPRGPYQPTMPQLAPYYSTAATLVGNLYKDAKNGMISGVNASNLRVVDFGLLAESHQYGSESSWFDADNLHQNPAGAFVYAAEIKKGIDSCPL